MRAQQFIKILTESKGHLDHPEDDVFTRPDSGARAISAIQQTANNPNNITIKWDGYPAVIFGRDPEGRFTIVDKHQFNRGARGHHTPTEWAKAELERGENARQGLIDIVVGIWRSLERASAGTQGYFWGDLLFSQSLQPQNGQYVFRANPNGITYRVDANSQLGKLLVNKTAGIAVHQHIPANATSTDDAVSLNGTLGGLKNDTPVAIVPSAMPVAPRITINKDLLATAINSVRRLGPKLREFMEGAPSKTQFTGLFNTYLNSRIVSGNLSNLTDGFLQWLQGRFGKQVDGGKISQSLAGQMYDYAASNKQYLRAGFKIWMDIYNLKNSIVDDLDRAAKSSPVKGYLDDGTETHEGFVSNGYKFVNRMGFSRQNLAARATNESIREAIERENKNMLIIYPGGFHPFHLGHASVFDHLSKKFSDGDVFVAATDSKAERPFGFEDKSFLANQSGVPKGRFVQVKSPYKATEITQKYNPDRTVLIFAVSEKDSNRFNFAPKKDGAASYFQPYQSDDLEPMTEHGYIYIVPKLDFKVLGKEVDSASTIRKMYIDGDEADRTQIIQDLYPLAKAPKRIKRILDNVLGGLMEADNPDYFGGSSQSAIPGTPDDLADPRSEQEKRRDAKRNAIKAAKLRKWMGHK